MKQERLVLAATYGLTTSYRRARRRPRRQASPTAREGQTARRGGVMNLKLLVSDEKFWAEYQKRLAELDAKVPPTATERKAA